MAKVSKNQYSVYLIRCLVNGKIYIGLTSGSVVGRLSRHKRQAKSGSQCLIHRAMMKHGFDNFEVHTIASGLDCQQACNLEIREIALKKASGSGGYNILAGGQSGKSLRPELTRARKSKAAKEAWVRSEKWQNAIHNPNRLKAISEASKKNFKNPKYREGFEQRHGQMVELSRSPEVRARAVETFKKNGHSVAVKCSNGMMFESASDAARWLNRKNENKAAISNILNCAKGKRKTAYGYSWELVCDRSYN